MLLHKRSNQVFYFRWRCPQRVREIVGKRELVRSLNTRNPYIAHVRASPYYAIVYKITKVLQMKRLTEAQVVSIINGVWQQKEQVLSVPLTFDQVQAEGGFEAMRRGLSDTVDGYDNAFDVESDRYPSVGGGVDDLVAHGLNPADYLPEDQGRLSQELTRLEYRFYSRLLKRLNDFERNPPTPDSRIILEEDVVPSSLLFSAVYRDFLQYKIQASNLSASMQGDYQRYFEDMIDLMGDLPIADISKNTIKDFLLLKYRKLPKRILKPYKNKKASELLQMTIPKEHLISDGSVNGIRKFIQGVFAYAVERELISASPATSLKLGLELDETYGVFTKPQVQKILGWAAGDGHGRTYKHREQKRWIVLIAAYTGARLGEIVQLRKVDVKTDADTGRYYIRITVEAGSVKTSAGERSIPIHDRLIEAGFLAMVERSDERLFPDIEASAITGWFRRLKGELQLPEKDGDGHPLVFHSFRHTVITLVRARGVGLDLGLVQQVIGHEKSNEGVTERYTHKHSVADLCRVVDTINYFD